MNIYGFSWHRGLLLLVIFAIHAALFLVAPRAGFLQSPSPLTQLRFRAVDHEGRGAPYVQLCITPSSACEEYGHAEEQCAERYWAIADVDGNCIVDLGEEFHEGPFSVFWVGLAPEGSIALLGSFDEVSDLDGAEVCIKGAMIELSLDALDEPRLVQFSSTALQGLIGRRLGASDAQVYLKSSDYSYVHPRVAGTDSGQSQFRTRQSYIDLNGAPDGMQLFGNRMALVCEDKRYYIPWVAQPEGQLMVRIEGLGVAAIRLDLTGGGLGSVVQHRLDRSDFSLGKFAQVELHGLDHGLDLKGAFSARVDILGDGGALLFSSPVIFEKDQSEAAKGLVAPRFVWRFDRLSLARELLIYPMWSGSYFDFEPLILNLFEAQGASGGDGESFLYSAVLRAPKYIKISPPTSHDSQYSHFQAVAGWLAESGVAEVSSRGSHSGIAIPRGDLRSSEYTHVVRLSSELQDFSPGLLRFLIAAKFPLPYRHYLFSAMRSDSDALVLDPNMVWPELFDNGDYFLPVSRGAYHVAIHRGRDVEALGFVDVVDGSGVSDVVWK